jgi:hypothetical protein
MDPRGVAKVTNEFRSVRMETMKLNIELSKNEVESIEQFLEQTKDKISSTHGPLTMETLVTMLLKDVATTMSRPGSWEGTHMISVLEAHGYLVF